MNVSANETDNDVFGDLPLHQFLTYRIARVHAKLNAQATRMLQEQVGITLAQWRVIALIGAAGQTTLTRLAHEAALDKGLLSRNVKSLAEQGMITSQTDEHDHRVQHLALSDSGQALFAKALPVTRARQARLRANLTPKEIDTFRRVLDKLEIAAET